MSSGGSFGVSATRSFDLDSQSGIAHVLTSIRASDLESSQKNELRDLVFLYVNGGYDPAVRLILEKKLASQQVIPVERKVTPSSRVTHRTPIGGVRRAPQSFAIRGEYVAPAPVAPPAPPAIPKKEETVVAPEPKPAPVVQSAPPPAPPIPPVRPPSAGDSHKVPVGSPKIISAPLPANSASQTSPDPQSQNLERIRKIKSIVNEKVGNPVNLVDINNEVGREYMGALLDAMKKIHSGASAVSAMRRLEASFIAVEKAIADHKKHPTESEPPKIVVAKTTPLPVLPKKEEAPKAPEPKPAPVAQPVPPLPHPTEPHVPPSVESQPHRVSPLETVREKSTTTVPYVKGQKLHIETHDRDDSVLTITRPKLQSDTREIVAEVKQSISPPVAHTPTVSSDADKRWANTTSTEPTNIPASRPITKLDSLADLKKPRQPGELPTSASMQTSTVKGDLLFTKEVTDGLNQLLLEWPIFKKSGLFGTGPKGYEHPLFKKIANLPIPLLLAGRFEGATQEIKQSITDYMNGWRYEQGIIYEQGETFEHYLRRVIRHILDLQIKKA